MEKGKSSKVKKYLGASIIILLSICFFAFIVAFGWIAGIIWLIFFRKKLNTSPGKQKKYTIGISAASVLSLFIFIYAMATAPPSPTMLVLSSDVEGETLEINNDYTLTVQYEPSDATLSAVTYKVDTPSLAEITTDSDNPSHLTLHTNGEGTINITAVRGSLESNTLSFEIIDSVRIEQEKAVEAEKEAEALKIAEAERAAELARIAEAEKAAEAAKIAETEKAVAEKEAETEKSSTEKIQQEEETTVTNDKIPESAKTEPSNETKPKNEEIKTDSAETPSPDINNSESEAQADSIPVENTAPATSSPSENNSDKTVVAQKPSTPEPEISAPAGEMVWLSATGSKYHSINNCGRMNPDKARQVSLEYAINGGYEKCSKCY